MRSTATGDAKQRLKSATGDAKALKGDGEALKCNGKSLI